MDETVRMWDANTGQSVAVLKTEGRYGSHFHSRALSTDCRLLVATSLTGDVVVWDVSSMQIVRLLEGHVGDVFAVAWSLNVQQIISAAGPIFSTEI